MRSGKDSIANHLAEKYKYTRGAFADILKEEVARAVPCDPTEFNTEPMRTQIRPVLQAWGTEFRRAQDPEYWVKQAEAGIQTFPRSQPIVFTDARFPNELDMLMRNGFLTLHVDMSLDSIMDYLRGQGKSSEEIGKMLQHPSETAWLDYPFAATVRSVMGDLEGLIAQVDNILEVNIR